MKSSLILRNLIIFTAVTLFCGWLGAWLNLVVPSPSSQQSLGILLWLMAPLVTVLFLRGLGKDGWQDFGLNMALRGNLKWYLLALLAYPLAIFLSLGLSAVFGAVSFDGLMTKGFGALLLSIVVTFIGSLVKNIFEEFAWRGYLTPRFDALGLGRLTNHLLTGLIWGLWHVPYWLFFLGPAMIADVSLLDMTWFIFVGVVGIFPTAIVYGELRLKTGSLWPAFLAHLMINAISAPLIVEKFIEYKSPASEIFFSPMPGGLILMVLFLGIGVWMLRRKSV